MLTIEDIRNPQRQSGFDHVNGIHGTNSHRRGKPWRATKGMMKKGSGAQDWRGTRRATPEEAAQDYCDYINGNGVASTATLATIDKSDRPQQRKRTISERERRLRKELRVELDRNPPVRMHDPVCYLIGIKHDSSAVKIGYADYNVYSRLDSLQTGNPRTLVLLGTLPGGIETEKKLHAQYAKFNILQEWFRPTRELVSEFGLTFAAYMRKIGI